MPSTAQQRFLTNLAAAFHAGEWNAAALRDAAFRATGQRFRWANALIKRILTTYTAKPTFPALLTHLERDLGLARICGNMARSDDLASRFPVHGLFFPPSPPLTRPPWAAALPELPSPAALAAWLGVTPGRLAWLADPAGRNRLHPGGPLRTYRYRWVPKPSGRSRLLEIPTPLLKRLQRKLLDELIARVPPHPAAHGFRPSHSAVTNAAAHCGRLVVVRFDLTDFFPSVLIGRVFALFRTLGYPDAVARLLAGLCTTRLPRSVWDARPNPATDGSDHAVWQRLGSRHLPQGAPTSPAVANLVAFRLDRRLAGLATEIGATYTRYADDLTFSGGRDLARGAKRLAHLVAVIAGEEGFAVNFRKTRVMGRGGRQTVTGVVVNAKPNVPRSEYDRLKATLTNCLRHGPATQNRAAHPDFRAHLAGKLAHLAAVNPHRGRKLWALFDRIAWPVPAEGG